MDNFLFCASSCNIYFRIWEDFSTDFTEIIAYFYTLKLIQWESVSNTIEPKGAISHRMFEKAYEVSL